jgi:hypothetical protein
MTDAETVARLALETEEDREGNAIRGVLVALPIALLAWGGIIGLVIVVWSKR